MVKFSRKELSKEWYQWLRGKIPNNPYAINLWLKQRYRPTAKDETRHHKLRDSISNALQYHKGDFAYPHKEISVGITTGNIRDNYRHFLNVLNRAIYKRQARNKGLSVTNIACYEFSESHRYHIHAIIGRPNQVNDDTFREYIASSWDKTHWGYGVGDMVAESDDGWLRYITKLSTDKCEII